MSYKELHINVSQIDSIQLFDFREIEQKYIIQEEDDLRFGLWVKRERGFYLYKFTFHGGNTFVKLCDETDEKSINDALDKENEGYDLESHIIYKDGKFQKYPKVVVSLISGKKGTFGFKTYDEAEDFVDELTSLNPNVRLIDER